MDDVMRIADRIFDLAATKFPDQRAFAEALELPPSVISAWRNYKSASFNKRIPDIAQVLGTTPEYLLTGEKKETATLSSDSFSVAEVTLVKLFRRLTPEQQDMVIRMVQAASDRQ